jgi:Ferritin-like
MNSTAAGWRGSFHATIRGKLSDFTADVATVGITWFQRAAQVDNWAGMPGVTMTDKQNKLPTSRSRRTILKALAAPGLAVPAICLSNAVSAAAPAPQPTHDAHPDITARGFADPVLELVRLLRDAADMEHASLLQYSYSAFSLKTEYESISGYGSHDAISLLTIAIEKMMHLGAVNRMLVVLGAPPRLLPPSFPFRRDASPLAFNLEPLSREALALYTYREAPQRLFDSKDIETPDGKLVAAACEMLGAPIIRATSIYTAIVAVAGEVSRSSSDELPDITRWIDAMRVLEDRGRESRFEFLRDLFLGSDPIFAGRGDIWRLPITDPGFPSYDIVRHSAAHIRQPYNGSGSTTLALSRLGNLQYGTALALLDLYFRHHIPTYRSLAITHMMGPVRSIGKYLPRLGAGMPYEAIDVPDSSVLDAKHRLRFILPLLQEGQNVAETIGPGLPPDYPLSINRDTMTKLREVETRNEPGVSKAQ